MSVRIIKVGIPNQLFYHAIIVEYQIFEKNGFAYI